MMLSRALKMGKTVGTGDAPCSRGRTLSAGVEGCHQREKCDLHPSGDHLHQPPLALPKLLCPSLDVCSTWHKWTLVPPCCWPRDSTKRCVFGLGGNAQSTLSGPGGDSLGVGCCKAVDGWTVRKPSYSKRDNPTTQPPDWDFCTPPLHGTAGVKWCILLQRV